MPGDVSMWSDLLAHYRNGSLWNAGGISDQPQVYLEAMQTLDYWSKQLAP